MSMYAKLIKYLPYLFMVVVLFSWYTTYTTAIEENDKLSFDNKVLKANEKDIIEAYESAAIVIEEVAFQQGLNKGASESSKLLNENIKKLESERVFNEINNDVYSTTDF